MNSSSDRLFGRQRTVHELLGAGFIADIILWRRQDLTSGILLMTLAVWVVFEKSGYTLLSLVSSVLLLLVVIFFVWAKSASLLGRPPPPLPELHLSEEAVNEAAAIIRCQVNAFCSVSLDIALGKDSDLFFKVAGALLLLSVIGGWTDFLTLAYTSLFLVLTVPALYEKYEDQFDKHVMIGCRGFQRLYTELDMNCFSKIRELVLEIKKLD
ncbi:hypothetical protein MKW94_024375 [Papaver nudicaule]|uniref:Reticulon-like protein n=1 Tax=Papaver nudicaule TaxID=74823 RepID=A0AA41VLF3_PAPNU|nr:hypothetical protein [Papaver nudicaule]MCL7043309.1 hypothetical protein [Papaver nudicaule]